MVRELLSGMSARLIVLPVAAVATIFTTRLINAALGPQTFAVYSLVAGLPLLFPVADLGLGAAITNAASVAETDPGRFHSILRRSLAISFVVAFLIAATSVFLGASGLWPRLLGLSDPSLNAPISIAMAIFGFSVPGGLGTKILLGVGRYVHGVIIQGLTPVFSLGVIGAALGFGAQTAGVVAVSSLGVFLTNWIGFLFAAISMPGAPAGYHRGAQRGVLGEVIRTATPMIAMTAGGAVVYQSGRLVLSHVSTLQQVAVYSALWTFFQPLMSVVVTAGLALWPRFAAARSMGRPVRNEFQLATLASAAIGLFAGIGLTVLGPFAVDIATAGKVVVTYSQCAILGATLTVLAMMLPAGMILTFPRGLWLQAGAAWVASVIVIVVGLAGSGRYGATAPLVGIFTAIAIGEAIPIMVAANVSLRRPERSRASHA
ncbi:hypothetical protein MANY_48990 [Mycolicibacterium anyangense]|uniref:Polysaccharide biosynthesis protein n=1 Tax=Mycolicibacterium anyangense TaxID=1431246 RepID=A0A6N4WI26_9MYCO|nr:hypothetical protein [Mycolicibacterium anyangense]BBZ79562.1 hypothetical protein MANY_48990 [Mycolicibacterium anyangense]